MKNFVVNAGLALLCLLGVAANAQTATCPALPQQVAVYFGNGINTDQRSSRRSMQLLRDNLGTTHNNKTLRYDTAYNATDGMVSDLVQAAKQAGVQWSSDLANWLHRQALAPAWFVQWQQAQARQYTLGLLPELDQHVQSYRRAISLGQHVLVVAHSQGNFYANDAVRQLSNQLTAEQMQSMAVFGVAVPANNVAGRTGPYYTNHRDFIHTVPGALPFNWNLTRSNGLSADNVSPIAAHSFEGAYLSADFDMRVPIVDGIKKAIDNLAKPEPVCDDYWKHAIAFFQGDYKFRVNDVPGFNMKINTNGVIQYPFGIAVDYSARPRYNIEAFVSSGYPSLNHSITMKIPGKKETLGWIDGLLYGLYIETPHVFGPINMNGVAPYAAAEYLTQNPLKNSNLLEWMLQPAQGLRGYMYCSSEVDGLIPGVTPGRKIAVPVLLSGTKFYINGAEFDFAMNKKGSTTATVAEEYYKLPDFDVEPTIKIQVNNTDYTGGVLTFGWVSGLKNFHWLMPSVGTVLFCSLD